MNINAKDVVVSKHVAERVAQRFGNIVRNYTHHPEALRNFIIAQISTGQVLDDWKQVPFYKNKIDAEFGQGTEIIRKSGIFYISRWKGNKLLVITAVHKMLYYPTENSVVITTSGGARHVNRAEWETRLHTDALKEYRYRKRLGKFTI